MKKIITAQHTMKHKSSKEVNLADEPSRKSPKRKRKKTKTAISRSISKV